MLNFIIREKPPIKPLPLSGQPLEYELKTYHGVWINDIWKETQSNNWIYVDRLATHNKNAASLLHAMELGIASAARWIAVELLKHPKPPTKKKIVNGIALWLVRRSENTYTIRLHSSNSKRGSHIVLGTLDIREELCGISDVISSIDCTGWCATKEQAIDIIIHQSAPWIAAAIVGQIEAKQ